MRKVHLIACFLMVFISFGLAQNYNSHEVQQGLLSIKANDEVSTDRLAKKFLRIENPYDRVRCIFEWQVNFMKYDYYSLNNNMVNETRTSTAFALKYKKGVCASYANLFKEICDKSAIECIIITGWAFYPNDSITFKQENGHAWNAVKINDEWKLIDVTWADNIQLDEFYYFTKPEDLIKNHFPENPAYQFLNEPYNKETYKMAIL